MKTIVIGKGQNRERTYGLLSDTNGVKTYREVNQQGEFFADSEIISILPAELVSLPSLDDTDAWTPAGENGSEYCLGRFNYQGITFTAQVWRGQVEKGMVTEDMVGDQFSVSVVRNGEYANYASIYFGGRVDFDSILGAVEVGAVEATA